MSFETESAEAVFCSALVDGIETMGLSVGPEVIEGLGRHYTLMCRWASRINLTSITDPVSAAHIHGLDCLLFAELFDHDSEEEVADVGSGAGFPGIVLALARPRLKICLIEPLRKRTSFLQVATAQLLRPDVKIKMSKLLECETAAWQTDVLVSRATIAPLQLIQLAAPYLRPGGRLITTSGDGAVNIQELKAAAKDKGFQLVERHASKLPGGQTRILDEFTLVG